MKTLKFFVAPFALLCFLSIFTTSCQKDEVSAQTMQSTERQDRTRGGGGLCGNYDYYGELHNQAVEYVLSFEDEIANMPSEEVEAFLISTTETYLTTVELEGTAYPEEGLEWSLLTEVDANDYGHMIEASILTDYEKSRANELVNDVLASGEANGGLDAVLDIVSSFECEIENDEEIVNLKELQAMSSVARHSATLWFNHSNDEPSYRAEDVILADAMGALYGSAIGPWGMLGFGALNSALSYAYAEGYID